MVDYELRNRELLVMLKQEIAELCTVLDVTPHAYGVEKLEWTRPFRKNVKKRLMKK